MKKLIILFTGASLAMLTFSGCKKGENDPFISFKSRDARITAKWKLTKIEGTIIDKNGVTTTIKYDGTNYSETDPAGSKTATGTFEMTVEKGGKVTYSETYTPKSGSPEVYSGTTDWFWLGSDKSKLYWFSGIYNPNLFGGGGKVDRLSGKELVFIDLYEEVDDGDKSSQDITYSFEKQ